jgi:hypothetical protein
LIDAISLSTLFTFHPHMNPPLFGNNNKHAARGRGGECVLTSLVYTIDKAIRFPLQACSRSSRRKGAVLELMVARVVRAAMAASCCVLWGGFGRVGGDGGKAAKAQKLKHHRQDAGGRCGNGFWTGTEDAHGRPMRQTQHKTSGGKCAGLCGVKLCGSSSLTNKHKGASTRSELSKLQPPLLQRRNPEEKSARAFTTVSVCQIVLLSFFIYFCRWVFPSFFTYCSPFAYHS